MVIKHFIITAFSKVSLTLFSLLSTVFVVWNFGALGIGIFALLRTIPLFIVLFTECGVSHSLLFLVNNKKINSDTVFSTSLSFAFFVSLIQVFGWFLISDIVADTFELEFTSLALTLCCMLAPLQVLQTNLLNIFRTKNENKLANLLLVSAEFCLFCLTVVFWLYGYSSFDFLVYGILISNIFIILIFSYFMYKKSYLTEFKFSYKVLKMSFGFGIKSQLGNAFQVLNYRLDQMLIGGLLGPQYLGVYVVASKTAEFFKIITLSIVFVLEPVLSKLEKTQAVNFVKGNLLKAFGFNFIFILLGALIAPYAIPIVFDSWSSASVPIFQILLIGIFISGSNGLFASFFLGQGLPQYVTLATGFTVVFSVSSNFLLIPVFGVTGAAYSSVISYLTLSLSYASLFAYSNKKI